MSRLSTVRHARISGNRDGAAAIPKRASVSVLPRPKQDLVCVLMYRCRHAIKLVPSEVESLREMKSAFYSASHGHWTFAWVVVAIGFHAVAYLYNIMNGEALLRECEQALVRMSTCL